MPISPRFEAFKFDKFYKQMAVGTGVGIRYDMGMFVVRVDWGMGLHLPYDTGKSGFYNIPSFKKNPEPAFGCGLSFLALDFCRVKLA